MTAIEQNKLIAEFMGQPYIHKYGFKNQMGYEYKLENGLKEWWSEDALRYHTSWDWLMPVVERIWWKLCDTNKIGKCKLSITQISIFADLELVHNAVVDFIEWYKKNEIQTSKAQ